MFEDILSEMMVSETVMSEMDDYRAINPPRISDKTLPLIILFGAHGCGKTMLLARLARYLLREGYSVDPIRDFWPECDYYEKGCNIFYRYIDDKEVVSSFSLIHYLLLKVSKAGRPICQLLELPGEHFFLENYPFEPFPLYIHALLELDMPRTCIFFLKKDRWCRNARSNYADKIASTIKLLNNRDHIILLHPKADYYPDLYDRGRPQAALFFSNIREDYEAVFNKLSDRLNNSSWFYKIFKVSNYSFVAFSSGVFSGDPEKALQTFTESNDIYPAKLWDTILRSIRD